MTRAHRPLLWFVVATRNRPDRLRLLLTSLRFQTLRPDGIVVVDASDNAVPVPEHFRDLDWTLKVLRHHPPSAAAQRNRGVAVVPEGVDLVGFLDDDAVLAPDSVEEMLAFWSRAPDGAGAASFNMWNHPPFAGNEWKRSRVLDWLGLYGSRPGSVSASGWATAHGRCESTERVEWLPSGAIVWRRDVWEELGFDEFFSGYSYLEDLEVSYRASRRWELFVVADALYWHLPADEGRMARFSFGKTEVRNRLYFVRKHGLSRGRCWSTLCLRCLLSLAEGVLRPEADPLRRAAGNAVQMAAEFRKQLIPSAADERDGPPVPEAGPGES